MDGISEPTGAVCPSLLLLMVLQGVLDVADDS
jgi:hypothetical protein